MGISDLFKTKVVKPLKDQLTQGADPRGLAQSAAVGAIMGIIPYLGISTGICLVIAAKWKLNQVVVQVFNYIVYPLQFLLIPVFMSLGAKLTGAPAILFDVSFVVAQAKIYPGAVLEEYGIIWLKAGIPWLLSAPVLYFMLVPIGEFVFARILRKKSTPA
jgi:hypothetical protein